LFIFGFWDKIFLKGFELPTVKKLNPICHTFLRYNTQKTDRRMRTWQNLKTLDNFRNLKLNLMQDFQPKNHFTSIFSKNIFL